MEWAREGAGKRRRKGLVMKLEVVKMGVGSPVHGNAGRDRVWIKVTGIKKEEAKAGKIDVGSELVLAEEAGRPGWRGEEM